MGGYLRLTLTKDYMKKEFINSTIGMMATHPMLSGPRLVMVAYYRTSEGILLQAVSGHNLETIRIIKGRTITKEEYNDREFDHCNNTKEYFWAIGKLGFNTGE